MEVKEKREYLIAEDQLRGPEELSGILSQGVYYWLNQIILKGYRKALSFEDLYPLDDLLSAQSLQLRFSKNWGICTSSIASRVVMQLPGSIANVHPLSSRDK